jgi:hypothetical protein
MVVLVTIETVVLALMALLVAGLLRSHAEILRRLEGLAREHEGSHTGNGSGVAADPRLPPSRAGTTPAFDISGETLDGDALKLAMATDAPGGTLLAFLSSGCATCGSFWAGLRHGDLGALPGVSRVVVVTRGPSMESPSKLRDLMIDGRPPNGSPARSAALLVMSSRAWEDYRVAGSPYFILVDRSGQVAGEGTAATSWAQVASLIRDAEDDAATGRTGRRGMNGEDRIRRADAELAAAGIGPGHPSLYGLDPPAVDAAERHEHE